MPDPFTIRIYVPDGDPDGIRLIDRFNWTGLGVVFPRSKWPEVCQRPEMQKAGIYILVGYQSAGDELPTVYVGQADGVKARIDSHTVNKDFWERGIVFVSSGGLNRAHVTWLEHALVRRALEAKQCVLDNGNEPQEPALSEAEKADTRGFLKEVLQILPLVNLRAFEIPKPVATPTAILPQLEFYKASSPRPDTVIVPAQKDGFNKVYLGENCWRAIRIAGGMLDKIKYVAAYQTQPVSAITHVAQVASIEPYGDGGKYQLRFSGPAEAIGPIPFGDAPGGAMQGPRYTYFEKLKTATKLTDLIGKS